MQTETTTTKTEVIAGITTFLTMAYIVFVQPAVLSTDFTGQPTGLDFGAVLLATCVVSGAATILRRPACPSHGASRSASSSSPASSS